MDRKNRYSECERLFLSSGWLLRKVERWCVLRCVADMHLIRCCYLKLLIAFGFLTVEVAGLATSLVTVNGNWAETKFNWLRLTFFTKTSKRVVWKGYNHVGLLMSLPNGFRHNHLLVKIAGFSMLYDVGSILGLNSSLPKWKMNRFCVLRPAKRN